jgi:hypothetical protein
VAPADASLWLGFNCPKMMVIGRATCDSQKPIDSGIFHLRKGPRLSASTGRESAHSLHGDWLLWILTALPEGWRACSIPRGHRRPDPAREATRLFQKSAANDLEIRGGVTLTTLPDIDALDWIAAHESFGDASRFVVPGSLD